MTNPVRKMTAVEAAWLAAVIDGEGSIGLYVKGRRNTSKSNKHIGRTVVVQMGNTHRGFVERMREIIGCGITVHRCKEQPSRKGRLPMFKFSLEGSERCRSVLVQVFPYLIIKKDKAAAILRELEERPFGRWRGPQREAARKAAAEKTRSSWQARRRSISGSVA